MRKPKAPCNGCERRRFRCHSMCVEYAAFCYDNEAYWAMIQDNKDKEYAAESVAVQRSTRAKKSSGDGEKMRRLLMYFCSAMCWVCIIGAGVTWGVKAAATVALALLLMAVIAAVIVVEYKEEVEAEIGIGLEAVQAFIRDKEGDGDEPG